MSNKIEETAVSLRKALKGLGTDQATIIKVVSDCTNEERQEIKVAYAQKFGRNLEKDLKSDCGGNFLKAILALFQPLIDYEVECIYNALKSHKTNHKALRHILVSKLSEEIEPLKEAFERIYQTDLATLIRKKHTGKKGEIYHTLLTVPRSEDVDQELAVKQAKELYKAGQGRLGTKDTVFTNILCTQSYDQLQLVFEEYFKQTRNEIDRAIRKEMGGDLREALLCIVKCVRDRPSYFAEQIHDAVAGLGTNNDDLIRLIVTRQEIDLSEIRSAYRTLYSKSLYFVVKNDTSGDYKRLCLALIGDEKNE